MMSDELGYLLEDQPHLWLRTAARRVPCAAGTWRTVVTAARQGPCACHRLLEAETGAEPASRRAASCPGAWFWGWLLRLPSVHAPALRTEQQQRRYRLL
jgi:hypothetical protein